MTTVRPMMLYVVECLAMINKDVDKVNVTEMHISSECLELKL